MLSSLLLPLLVGGPALAAAGPADDPPIRLWISNDGNFLPGDLATVEVRTKGDGYLIVFHVDPEGHLRVLFPVDPDEDSFIRGGRKYEIRGRGGRESFEVDTKIGKGTVYAAVSRDPLHFDGFVLGDHWDYRALAPSRLPEDAESDLNELVRRIAQTDFDYDLINYYVSQRVAYQTDYSSSYSGSAYYGPGCYGWSCGSYYGSPYGLSIGFFFGQPYRRYYYDPYYYAYTPFYNPFFYYPYYYHPRYVYPYSPYYGYPRYYPYGYHGHRGYPGYPGYPGYRNRYFHDRNGTYPQPYTPYRFRGADGFNAGYRNGGGPTHWVNNSPFATGREGPLARAARRAIQPSGENSASTKFPREVVGSPRLERHQVQARRAGEPAVRIRNRGEMESAPGRREIEDPRSGPQGTRVPVARRAEQPDRGQSRGTPSGEVRGRRVPATDARSARREGERNSAGEPRPARGPERVTMPAGRSERREVSRPSAPSQNGGGPRSVGEGGRRHR